MEVWPLRRRGEPTSQRARAQEVGDDPRGERGPRVERLKRRARTRQVVGWPGRSRTHDRSPFGPISSCAVEHPGASEPSSGGRSVAVFGDRRQVSTPGAERVRGVRARAATGSSNLPRRRRTPKNRASSLVLSTRRRPFARTPFRRWSCAAFSSSPPPWTKLSPSKAQFPWPHTATRTTARRRGPHARHDRPRRSRRPLAARSDVRVDGAADAQEAGRVDGEHWYPCKLGTSSLDREAHDDRRVGARTGLDGKREVRGRSDRARAPREGGALQVDVSRGRDSGELRERQALGLVEDDRETNGRRDDSPTRRWPRSRRPPPRDPRTVASTARGAWYPLLSPC